MDRGWRTVLLGEAMQLCEERVVITEGDEYPQVGIRAFGCGMFRSETVSFGKTSYSYFNKIQEGMIVVSQVKGWEGAIGLCGEDFNSLFVSPEYRTFRCIDSLVDPSFLFVILTAPSFRKVLRSLTRWQGARRERLRPELLLRASIRLPPLGEQRRIVARLDRVERLAKARLAAIDTMEAEAEAMLRAVFERLIEGAPLRPMAEVAPLVRRPVEIDPDKIYTEIGVKSFYKGIFH